VQWALHHENDTIGGPAVKLEEDEAGEVHTDWQKELEPSKVTDMAASEVIVNRDLAFARLVSTRSVRVQSLLIIDRMCT